MCYRLRDHKESKKEKILLCKDLADNEWGPINIYHKYGQLQVKAVFFLYLLFH